MIVGMDALIEYATLCPDCLKLNPASTVNLKFDQELGGICCENGHVYEQLPEDPTTNAPAPEKAKVQDGNASAPAAPEAAPIPQASTPETESLAVSTVEMVLAKASEIPQRLPGGRLAVVVILDELPASAVQAEADNQRRPFAEYFSEWVNEALSNYWGNLPKPR